MIYYLTLPNLISKNNIKEHTVTICLDLFIFIIQFYIYNMSCIYVFKIKSLLIRRVAVRNY